MLIKNLKDIELKKANLIKTSTGNIIHDGYTLIKSYRVQDETLQDQITSTIYGSDVNKMKRIASPLHDLEKYLMPKVDNIEDNIKDYYIILEDIKYKIVAVRDYFIDIKRI